MNVTDMLKYNIKVYITDGLLNAYLLHTQMNYMLVGMIGSHDEFCEFLSISGRTNYSYTIKN